MHPRSLPEGTGGSLKEIVNFGSIAGALFADSLQIASPAGGTAVVAQYLFPFRDLCLTPGPVGARAFDIDFWGFSNANANAKSVSIRVAYNAKDASPQLSTLITGPAITTVSSFPWTISVRGFIIPPGFPVFGPGAGMQGFGIGSQNTGASSTFASAVFQSNSTLFDPNQDCFIQLVANQVAAGDIVKYGAFIRVY